MSLSYFYLHYVPTTSFSIRGMNDVAGTSFSEKIQQNSNPDLKFFNIRAKQLLEIIIIMSL
jgi:hypothetical protein